MKSVRTTLSKISTADFRLFLDYIGLQEVKLGDYDYIGERWYSQKCICYAYREKSNETVAILTHITLKYGNLQTAYNEYIDAVMTSLTTDPYFNWTP
jgi:hypothetical protein